MEYELLSKSFHLLRVYRAAMVVRSVCPTAVNAVAGYVESQRAGLSEMRPSILHTGQLVVTSMAAIPKPSHQQHCETRPVSRHAVPTRILCLKSRFKKVSDMLALLNEAHKRGPTVDKPQRSEVPGVRQERSVCQTR